MSFLVATGRIAGGYTFYGPFESEAECRTFIERLKKDVPYRHCEILPCISPAIL